MKRNEHTLAGALALVESLGFSRVYVRDTVSGRPILVRVLQKWFPSGEEYASIVRARGKWAGEAVGSAYRAKPLDVPAA